MCSDVGVYSHSGDVFTREGIGGVANQQAGLTHSPEEEGQQIFTDVEYSCMLQNAPSVYSGRYVRV